MGVGPLEEKDFQSPQREGFQSLAGVGVRLVVPRIVSNSSAYAALVGVALLAASCGGGGDKTVAPPTIGSIVLSPANPAPIVAGGVLQLSASVRDTDGQPISGQTVAYTSSAPSIATVSDQGLVSAVGPVGAATITATAGSATANAPITVVPGAAASLTRTSPDPSGVFPGAPAGDSVRFVVKDAFANPKAGELVLFTVSAGQGHVSPNAIATDAAGRVATMFTTGASAGTNTLVATSGSLPTVSFSLVTAGATIAITSVVPAPMTPGATITVNGSGFSSVASEDTVTIDGQRTTVTSASPTQLIISVPTTMPCTPAHAAKVRVAANSGAGIAQATLQVGTIRTLAVGAAVVVQSAADLGCIELSGANARYVVNVLNVANAPTAATSFHFAGATPAAIPAVRSNTLLVKSNATVLRSNTFTLKQSAQAPARLHAPTRAAIDQSGVSAAHLRMLDANNAILQQMRNRLRRTPGGGTAISSPRRASLATTSVVAGNTRTFNILQPSTGTSGPAFNCSSSVPITARAVYVGTRGIVWEDKNAPLAGTMDDAFIAIGSEFDTSMYPSDSTYFGDPLVTDPQTDHDGHLNLVFSPSVPAGIVEFADGCDFLPPGTGNEASNFGENFYGRVPSGAGSDTKDAWLALIRATIVHEVKHIASFGARFLAKAPPEETWLEEGMAFTAEEVWARDRIYGTMWKGNAGYDATINCEGHLTVTGCAGKPIVMFDHFSKLYPALDQQGSVSLFGRVSSNDLTFYGNAWSFIRYNADRYAGSDEVGFLRGITQSTTTGLANIAHQTGADPEQMLGMWSLSLYLDENTTVTGVNKDLDFPSWNLRDIYSRLSADFPPQFPKPYPLVPQAVPSGDFSIDNAGIRGGSFALYDLAALTASGRTLTLVPGGQSTSLRLVIARIQ
jgi:hypothetical protein